MRALVWHGARDVRVDTVPDPQLVEADDLILRITATAICGSDLHLYRGKMPGMKEGDVLGHEFMGIVEEVGPGVTSVERGDRVVVPFVIACGECYFCERDLYSACETTNPSRGTVLDRKDLRPAAALYGYTHFYGGYSGGQAEWVRVPKANSGPFRVGSGLSDTQVLLLSDVLPTAYQAVVQAEVGPGSTVAIFGAGPVGLMSAACARMLGAGRIFVIDHHEYRLRYAREAYDAETINFDRVDDPAAEIVAVTDYRGVDATIDAVGFEAKGNTVETMAASLKLEGGSGFVLRQAIAATRRGGVVSVPGVYAGFIHAFMFGDAFEKGLTFRMGQTHVQRWMPELLECIEKGKIRPEQIITHELPLERAVDGYEIFNEKREGCRKVVLRPAA